MAPPHNSEDADFEPGHGVQCSHMGFTAPGGFLGGSVVNELPANAGDVGDAGSIPGLERSPGGRKGNPLQYSGLENPMDRGGW